jgi:hypothetical protein
MASCTALSQGTSRDETGSSSDPEKGFSDGEIDANDALNLNHIDSALSIADQGVQSIISRIRTREAGQHARSSRPLMHTKNSLDVIVDFEGPDDPYLPVNWTFRKKAITTVLFGLTTMGKF